MWGSDLIKVTKSERENYAKKTVFIVGPQEREVEKIKSRRNTKKLEAEGRKGGRGKDVRTICIWLYPLNRADEENAENLFPCFGKHFHCSTIINLYKMYNSSRKDSTMIVMSTKAIR